MIAVHLEPKGLAPDTPSLRTREHEAHAQKAARGSRRLRDAIRHLQGLKPILIKPVVCPTCFAAVGAPKRMVATIQNAVAAYYGLHPNAMTSNDRRKEVSHPRQVAMCLAVELTRHSIADIGRFFNRDHTTVLHALKSLPKRCETSHQEALDVALLRERLAG